MHAYLSASSMNPRLGIIVCLKYIIRVYGSASLKVYFPQLHSLLIDDINMSLRDCVGVCKFQQQ